MKNKLTILALVAFTSSFGQKLVVTPTGLRDERDNEKTFVVLEVDSLTANQLFDNAKSTSLKIIKTQKK